MGPAAREVYLAEYTPAANYQTLIRIYEEAVDRNNRHAREYAGTPSSSDAGGERDVRNCGKPTRQGSSSVPLCQ